VLRRVEEGVAGSREREVASIAVLAQMYEQGYRRFLRVAEAIVRDPELARDVVQDAFARAIRSRFDYRGDGTVDGWVWRTLVNTALNAKRDRPPAHLPLDKAAAGARAAPNGLSSHGELRALLALLPERQRLVVFLRYYADLDYRQVAEALEIEVGTVGATLHHARAALRRALGEEKVR
jgi:RNA polymerase sigma factor (sigma-70 family)